MVSHLVARAVKGLLVGILEGEGGSGAILPGLRAEVVIEARSGSHGLSVEVGGERAILNECVSQARNQSKSLIIIVTTCIHMLRCQIHHQCEDLRSHHVAQSMCNQQKSTINNRHVFSTAEKSVVVNASEGSIDSKAGTIRTSWEKSIAKAA